MEEEIQNVWTLHKDEHLAKGYVLEEVQEVYFPIWKCQQEIITQKETSLDGFSQVILQMIATGHAEHEAICALLGIELDSFVLGQFHYLLKEDYIRLNSAQIYWLTPKGRALLEKEANVEALKTLAFEYYTLEPNTPKKGNLNLQFFNPKLPLNPNLSEEKKKRFKGYRIFQNNRLEKNTAALILPHHQNQAPSLKQLKAQRNDFGAFFKESTGNNFYDFGTATLKCHPHSLCFLRLTYRKAGNAKDFLLDVRQFSGSVMEWKGFELEANFK